MKEKKENMPNKEQKFLPVEVQVWGNVEVRIAEIPKYRSRNILPPLKTT